MRGQFTRQYPVDDEFFDTIGEEQAWLLGLLAADGWVKNDRVWSIRVYSE